MRCCKKSIDKAVDKSGNIEEQPFTLIVQDPVTDIEKNTITEPEEPVYTQFTDVVKQHKTNQTKIGIDLSSFQGNVDF